jgi:hypothetical protein
MVNVTIGKTLSSILPGQWKPELCLLLLPLLLFGACRKIPSAQTQSGKSVVIKERHQASANSASPVPQRVAVTVNGTAILETEMDEIVLKEEVSREEAIRLVVQAELVAAEARQNGFPETKRLADRFVIARRFLETVYSEETLCSHISDREIRAYYEAVYQPGWPVDVYRGDLVELRCCPRLSDQCPVAEKTACMERNKSLFGFLQELAVEWGKGDLSGLESLQRNYPGLVKTDFGFIIWPGIPLGQQKPLELFDRSLVEAIIAQKAGDVVGPLISPLGFHLFKLKDFRAAIKPDSEEFREAAARTLCDSRIEQTRRDYVKSLVESAVVELH